MCNRIIPKMLLFTALFCWMATSLASAQADSDKGDILSYTVLQSPFRMKKVNLLWEKARRSLTEGKLQLLYSELKLQDKEEATLKRVKSEAGDKDGSLEASVRKRFAGIVNKYGLTKYGEDAVEEEEEEEGRATKNMYFKDKRLNRLWEKAEKAGLTEDELMTLKLEFRHHQSKVEEYNNLLEARAALRESDPHFNSLDFNFEDDDVKRGGDDNELSGKAREVKLNYDRLHKMATNTMPKEFQDEKAQALWKLAQEADFSPTELDSLRQELHHFEARIAKMHYMEAEMRAADLRRDPDDDGDDHLPKVDTEGRRIMGNKMKKHADEVDRMREHIERTIAARHSEL